MFTIRDNGNLITFYPISKNVVFAKTKVYGSVFNRFEDYTITLKATNSSISIWSNCKAIKTLSEDLYKNDFSALEKAFKAYHCMICTDHSSRFYSTMIFVSPKKIIFLNNDGTISKFRLTHLEKYFEFPSVKTDANI
ncbi:MAG: hypothetical protein IJH39_03220 [Clostridia bacterium]|nr:hypothetical protein [Clostridia bacterium]